MKRYEPIYRECYDLLQELNKISFAKQRPNYLPLNPKDSIQSDYLDYLEKESKAIKKTIVTVKNFTTFQHPFDFLPPLQKNPNSILLSVDIIQPNFNNRLKECENYLAKESFGFDETKFWLNKIMGKDLVIDFNPKEGETTNSFCLMKALVEYIKEVGELNNGWLSVIVPPEEIKKYMSLNYPKINIGVDWLKNSKGNLLKKLTTIDKKLIIIKDYDNQRKGYPFSIKLPLEST